MSNDPFYFLAQIGGMIFSGLVFLFWLVLLSRLGNVRDEARRQTKLLEEIAAQGRAKAPPKAPSSARYD